MQFIDPNDDVWRTSKAELSLPAGIDSQPHLLLDLAQWLAIRTRWPDSMPVGIRLDNNADVDKLADDLPRIALLALHFPKWTDGRAYSQARLLRLRYRFKGQIRATGEVLVDMLPLLERTGFDAVRLRTDQSLDAAKQALAFFSGHYQGDTRDKWPLFAQSPGKTRGFAGRPASKLIDNRAAW